jgi:hypothetical protein
VETKVKIEPAYVKTGVKVQYLCLGDWIDYNGGRVYTEDEARRWNVIRDGMRTENCGADKFRLVPATESVEAFPSRDYIEEAWLRGFQGVRRGEANPYGEPEAGEEPGYNFVLWAEGAEAFRAGQNIFA